ncbi:hypothetical protein NUW54_g14636 [Trametes sanguinea]|uniref:Uncharacterized protein n=1 Tax=Trametes sanguinea TaxID=158606 RepID=A0ACC1MD60_9APHY|nr:hypothetical protein NUW54_g14636 [Trametes sanguinea]
MCGYVCGTDADLLVCAPTALVLAVALVQSFMLWRLGGLCMLAMVIGEYTWAVGFGTRFGLHTQPDSQGIYIAYYLFIVLSVCPPCAFIASEYMLLGRLARYLKSHRHLLILAFPANVELWQQLSSPRTLSVPTLSSLRGRNHPGHTSTSANRTPSEMHHDEHSCATAPHTRSSYLQIRP